jgi:hypothetical protein
MKLFTPSENENKLYGLEFMANPNVQSRNAFIFMHGAGLDFTSSLYIDIANQLVNTIDVFLPGLLSSSFLNYNEGFRKPLGWSYHKCQDAIADYRIWIDYLIKRGYDNIILGGHSWGALLTLASTYKDLNTFPIILISPLPAMQSILTVNYGNIDENVPEINRYDFDDLTIIFTKQENTPFKFLSLGTIRSLFSFSLKLEDFMSLWNGSVLTIVGQKENAILLKEIKEACKKLKCENKLIEIPKEGHFYSRGRAQLSLEIKDFIGSLDS